MTRAFGRRSLAAVVAGAIAAAGGLLVMPEILGRGSLGQPTEPAGVLGVSAGVGSVSSNGGGSTKHLRVSVGSSVGLWPGRTVGLPVTVTNPNSFDISVTSYSVAVTGTSKPACAVDNLTTGPSTASPSTPVAVGRHGTAANSVPVTLRSTAPDPCAGARFTLSVTAVAVKR